MIVRVCLIIPPGSLNQADRLPVILGILAVAAVLEQAGFAVELVDLSEIGTSTTVAVDEVWAARWTGTA